MKLLYDRVTDSLFIDLNAKPGVDSLDVAEGRLVGIDIQRLDGP